VQPLQGPDAVDAKTSATYPLLKIRIDFDPEGRIGPGKIHLLEAIEGCGSISGAGRLLNISYRHAWKLLDDVARVCEHDVIVARTGGDNGGGAELTPFGRMLVARYRKIEQLIANATRDELQALESDVASDSARGKK
jgi:molybdate transport system regulatory protein